MSANMDDAASPVRLTPIAQFPQIALV